MVDVTRHLCLRVLDCVWGVDLLCIVVLGLWFWVKAAVVCWFVMLLGWLL